MYISPYFLDSCFSLLLSFLVFFWLFISFYLIVVLGYTNCVASRGIVERFQEHGQELGWILNVLYSTCMIFI